MIPSRFSQIPAILPAALLLLTASAAADDLVRLQGATMGTYYSVVIEPVDDASQIDRRILRQQIDDRLREINRRMSTWDPDSEISRFNKSQSTDWFSVSDEFAVVVVEARRIHAASGGAFDPTVSPLIDLWGFGDVRPKALPEQSEIDSALAQVGMQHLEVRTDPPALRKHQPELQLNLSAIAKGYGVDAIAELLTQSGYPAFIVDIGGENRAGQAKRSGAAWRIGVESPLGGLHRVVEVISESVATSGDYRNFFEINGVKYSHAIDPTTGRPVRNPPASVSVRHPSCMTADGWATALMVLGTERGITVARKHQINVMFQDVIDGRIRETSAGSFASKDPSGTASAENTDTDEPSSEQPNATQTTANDSGAVEQVANKPAQAESAADKTAIGSRNVTDAAAESAVGEFNPADRAPEASATRPTVEDSSGENHRADDAAAPVWFPFAAAGVLFLIAVAGMAIGTILQNRQLKGSCGGLASMPGTDVRSPCEFCTKPIEQCSNPENRLRLQQAASGNPDEQEPLTTDSVD
ncbi:MAG: FAD:protein FMN transferase [Planctomycetaceae bacterium]|nr:FAD:protein FMN transferase [Planctomycetaceae bacterium]